MDLKSRLHAIRDKKNATWKELAAALDISQGMLFACMSGKRKPSSRFLRRIASCESGEHPQQPSTSAMVKEGTNVNMSKKELNKRDIEHRLTTISAEIAAIREILKETDND